MTGKSMAGILAEHRLLTTVRCSCRNRAYSEDLMWLELEQAHEEHVASMLAAAGFGHIGTALDDKAEQEDS